MTELEYHHFKTTNELVEKNDNWCYKDTTDKAQNMENFTRQTA